MDLGLDGDAALVAASSSGLGRATARAFAAEGANVVINGRDRSRLEATADALRETVAGDVHPVAADLTDSAAVEALVAETVDAFGGLDHLVTNAGGPPGGPFLETSDADWWDAYELLVASAMRLCRHAGPHLHEDGGGTVTAITSLAVKEPAEGLVLSNAVRSSVIGLVKTLAREWAPAVRANVVMPGTHDTERIEDLAESMVEGGEFEDRESAVAAWLEDVPLGRMGDPDRFGEVVAFLAGEPAGFVNGTALVVDGGEARSVL